MGFTYIFYNDTKGKKYLELDFAEESLAYLTGQGFVTFWLLLVRFIPMDVIVNVEGSKIFGSLFMEFDTTMFQKDDQTGDYLKPRARSMQLPEELGQVSYLFCDKTGTLTKNELRMKKISVRGLLSEGNTPDEILSEVYNNHCIES